MAHESTRFFSVVGAAYVPESHGDRDDCTARRLGHRSEGVSLSWLTGWWPRARD